MSCSIHPTNATEDVTSKNPKDFKLSPQKCIHTGYEIKTRAEESRISVFLQYLKPGVGKTYLPS